MKTTIYTLAIAALLPTAALAGPNASQQISAMPAGPIKNAMRELNNEDQRVTDGTYNPNTGTLTLYTQDMKAGADGDISRRPVVIEGIYAEDGQDYDPHALAAVTAMGSLQMLDPLAGETTWAFGFGGQVDGTEALAGGIRYGFTDDLSAYATLGTSLDGKGTSWGVGVGGRF